MGLLDRFIKKKKKEEAEAYYLQYQPEGQKGWLPVERFAFPISLKEAMQYMVEPGVYNLQKRKGGMIAGYAWDEPYTVKGEAGEEGAGERAGRVTDSDRIATAIESDMVRAVRWFKLPDMIQSAIKKAFGGDEGLSGVLKGGAGLQIPEGKTLDQYLDDVEQNRYDRFKKQSERYGYAPKGSVSGEAEPEYEGKFPIWMHPKGIPAIVDGVLEQVDKRLAKWGLTGEEKPKKKMLELPEKPVKTKRLDLSGIKKKEEKVEKGGEKPGEK